MSEEKLDYLEREDVETMDKKIARLRLEESRKERERISSLGADKPVKPIENKKEYEVTIKPAETGVLLSPRAAKKIIIRAIFLLIFLGTAYFVYTLFT